jgi:uncharacterized membrane protein
MRLALAIHLLFFAFLAAGALGAKVLYGVLRAAIARSPAEGVVLVRAMLRFSIVAQIGAGLMLITGIGLLSAEHWAYWGQRWLTVKIVLFVIMVLNGPLVARPAANQLQGALTSGASGEAVAAPMWRLNVFNTVQVLGFAAIVLLAVLKPF